MAILTLTVFYTNSILFYDQGICCYERQCLIIIDKAVKYVPADSLLGGSDLLKMYPSLHSWDYKEFVNSTTNQLAVEFTENGVAVLCNNLCAIKYYKEVDYKVSDSAALAIASIPHVKTLRLGFSPNREWDTKCSLHFTTKYTWLNVLSLSGCKISNKGGNL